MPKGLIRPSFPPSPPMTIIALENARRAQVLAIEISVSEQRREDLTQLVLSEISDFFAGIGQPGEPETPEEMQTVLMARVQSVFSGSGTLK
ncbi:hypothetical protein ABRP70_19870 [Pectobacterium odoriferum]|nr:MULTISPECIES: hypothetical protein [Pectobacterium]